MKRFIFLSLALMLAINSLAQDHLPARADKARRNPPVGRQIDPAMVQLSESFIPDTLLQGGDPLLYSWKEYRYTDTKPCLFLYLHGGGGRSEGGNRHTQHAALLTLDTYLKEHSTDAVVVVPICPKGTSWEHISAHVCQLIDRLCEREQVDRSRIYLMGTSFGAQGGWGLLSERTDLFAAAQLASAAPGSFRLRRSMILRRCTA